MTEEELDKIGKVFDHKVKPIHGEIAKISKEVRELRFERFGFKGGIENLATDIARMDSTLDSLRDEVSTLTSRVNANSSTLMGIEKEIGAYNESTQINKKEIKSIKERLIKVESR